MICKLEDLVINRIAAGEVLQRPANAIKELMENSRDAGATSIALSIGEGGLGSITITDNGSGIDANDFPLLCERFATSKLRSFADLASISTFGFRGEALASISHVSRITVVSKREGAPLAYKAHWIDGKLSPLPGMSSSAPVACAGNKGTVLQVDRMFWNMPTRRKAFNADEEYSRILQTVQRYALLWNELSISCGKSESKSLDLALSPSLDRRERIKMIWGAALANSLVDLCLQKERFKFTGLASSLAWQEGRKFNFILFVNNRLVECTRLKKAIGSLYEGFLLKKAHPFVFGMLEVPGEAIDVNVHPTKNEVLIANEQEIALEIVRTLEAMLKVNSGTRNFSVPIIVKSPVRSAEGVEKAGISSPGPAFVRTDSKTASLEHVLSSQEFILSSPLKRKKADEEYDSITQIKNSKASIFSSQSTGYFYDCVYVGSVMTESKCQEYLVFQKGASLNYLKHSKILYESFYQTVLLNFTVEPANSLTVPNTLLQTIDSNSAGMLQDYFGVRVTPESISLPKLISNCKPLDHAVVNELVLSIVNAIDWTDEHCSFLSIIDAFARFWSDQTQPEDLPFLFDGLWKQLAFSEEYIKNQVVCLTDLHSLYKVFERC